MTVSVRELIALPQFALTLRCAPEGVAGNTALDRPIVWAHSSDLLDPTPWLESGQMLLSDGMQFSGVTDDAVFDAYAERLKRVDVAALGFATEIIHPEIPAQLIDACTRHGVIVVQIPRQVPFIGIIRAIADRLASEQRDRLDWSLRAQRQLARAALRPDGLDAILRELESQLDGWVAMFDSAGEQIAVPTRSTVPADREDAVSERVRALLNKGARASARLSGIDGDVTLQTIGQHGKLRGVLAVGGATPLDLAGNDLVASAIGHASIALEQSRMLDSAHAYLRSGLLELMLAGQREVATISAEQVWGALPSAPIRVIVHSGELLGQAFLDALDRLSRVPHHRFFYAQRGDEQGLDELVVIAAAADLSRIERLFTDNEVTAGFSGDTDWDELAGARAEAARAASRATAGQPFVAFESIATLGLIALLDDESGQVMATRVLAPLTEAGESGQVLLRTLRSWTENNCAWDPTARELGVHRHTLKNRIRAAQDALGIDLETFAGRAEVWAALRVLA